MKHRSMIRPRARVLARDHNRLGVTFYQRGAIDLALQQFEHRAVFALPEFDSPSIDRMILIADQINGEAFPVDVGPLQDNCAW